MNFEDFFAKIGNYIFLLESVEVPNIWGKFKLPSDLKYCPRTVWKCIVKCSDCVFNLGTTKDCSDIYEIIMFAYGNDVYFLKFNSVYDIFGDPWGYGSNCCMNGKSAETNNIYRIPIYGSFVNIVPVTKYSDILDLYNLNVRKYIKCIYPNGMSFVWNNRTKKWY